MNNACMMLKVLNDTNNSDDDNIVTIIIFNFYEFYEI